MRQGRRKGQREDASSTAAVGDPENSEKLTECLSDWPEGPRLEHPRGCYCPSTSGQGLGLKAEQATVVSEAPLGQNTDSASGSCLLEMESEAAKEMSYRHQKQV